MRRPGLMVLFVFLFIVSCLALATEPALASSDVKVYHDDVRVEFEGSRPYIQNGRTLVPVSYVSTVPGAEIDYDQVTGQVTITKGNDRLFLKPGSNDALLNGETVVLDVAPTLMQAEVMLPLRFVSEALGAWVEWWNTDRSVRVYSYAPTASPMANLMNHGLVTGGDGWTYYVTHDGIYSTRRDGSGLTKIADTEASQLNIYEDWLVFSPHRYSYSSANKYSGSPWVFRIRAEGGEPEEVAHVEARQVTVVGDDIYYTGLDYKTFKWGVYRMKVDGGDPELVVTTEVSSRFYIDGDWIYYTNKGIYRAKTDGTEVEQISDLLVHTYMIVSGGWIYSVRSPDGCLLRVSTDGTEVQELFSDRPCQGVNVADGWVYCCTRASGSGSADDTIPPVIWRMRLDGSDVQLLATLDGDAQSRAICVHEGWVFFEIMSPSKTVQYGVDYTLYRMNTDGSNFEIISKSEAS